VINENMDLFEDSSTAIQERDKALKQVADNSGEWMDRALAAVKLLAPGEYTGEDIRLAVIEMIGAPHHHNAWGAVVKMSLAHKAIRPTGRLTAMKTRKSHGRRTAVYYRG